MSKHCPICLKEFDTVQDYCAVCWVKVRARRMKMAAIILEEQAERSGYRPGKIQVLKGGL